MKHLLTILAAAIAVVVMQVACAADVSWTGKGGVVDWNATTWSTGTPPAATDTVMFTGTQDYADFTVTPPADFAGTILVLNRTGQDRISAPNSGRISKSSTQTTRSSRLAERGSSRRSKESRACLPRISQEMLRFPSAAHSLRLPRSRPLLRQSSVGVHSFR